MIRSGDSTRRAGFGMVLDTRIHELGRSNAVIVICMLLRMCCNRHRSTVPDFSCSTSVVRHAKVGPFTHAEVWKVVRSDMSSCSLVLLISFVLGRGVTRVKMNDHCRNKQNCISTSSTHSSVPYGCRVWTVTRLAEHVHE
jgi:hypothetical protein